MGRVMLQFVVITLVRLTRKQGPSPTLTAKVNYQLEQLRSPLLSHSLMLDLIGQFTPARHMHTDTAGADTHTHARTHAHTHACSVNVTAMKG